MTDKWHYFFDENNISERENVVLRPGPLKKHGPILTPAQPWETSLNGFGSILYDPLGREYRYYYNQENPRLGGVFNQCIMMATSRDGMRWQKPEFPRIRFDGRKTNLILIDLYKKGFGAVVPSVIRKDRNNWEMFYWAYYLSREKNKRQVCCLKAESKDGIVWRTAHPDRPVSIHTHPLLSRRKASPFDTGMKGLSDTDYHVPLAISRLRSNDASFIYWTPEEGYKFYGVWLGHNYGRSHKRRGILLRCMQMRTSRDGMRWSEPEMILTPEISAEPPEQFYYLSVTPFDGYYLGLLGIYRFDLAHDIRTIHAELVVSADGRRWQRPCREALIQLGKEGQFDSQMIHCANRMLERNGQWLIYYGGSSTPHAKDANEKHSHEGSLGLAVVAQRRLLGLKAEKDGMLRTKPFFFSGPDLKIDALVGPGGHLKAEITDLLGQPVKGFEFKDSLPVTGDKSSVILKWRNSSIRRFIGEMIAIRFSLKKTQLFAYSSGTLLN